MPAKRFVNTNNPWPSVMVSRVTAVAVLRTVTVAPGMAALLPSITEPPIWPVNPWASARLAAPPARPSVRRTSTLRAMKRLMFPPPGGLRPARPPYALARGAP